MSRRPAFLLALAAAVCVAVLMLAGGMAYFAASWRPAVPFTGGATRDIQMTAGAWWFVAVVAAAIVALGLLFMRLPYKPYVEERDEEKVR